MKKLNRTHKTKDEKRRLLLTRKYAMSQKRIQKHGSDSVGAIAVDYNRRFIAAFVALVIAISCMAVGFGVRTKAEEYSEEDKPIDMFIMVNDELLTVTQKENSEFYKAVFPSALVDGDIAAGLTYQKTDESGNILIESIISNLNERIYGDQSDYAFEDLQSVEYLNTAVATMENGSPVLTDLLVQKTIINEDGNIVYLLINDESETVYTLNEDECIVLSFSAEEKIEPLADSDEDNNSELSNTLYALNAVAPRTISMKAAALKSSSSQFSPVSGVQVRYNSTEIEDFTVSFPAGDISDALSSTSLQNQLSASGLDENATNPKVLVQKSDGSETEIVRLGTYQGQAYYSLSGDTDTGIALESGEKIILSYTVKYTVTYEGAPAEGGTVNEVASGGVITSEAMYGEPIYLTFEPYYNGYYAIDSASYAVNNGDSIDITNTIDNGAYQIPGENVKGNIVVSVNYSQHSTFNIIGESLTQGHICAYCSIAESATDGDTNDDIAGSAYGTFSGNNLPPNFKVSAGGTAYVTLYSQSNKTSWWSSSTTVNYFLNKIWINGEEVNVPNAYTAGATNTTTMSNGSVVTIKLIGQQKADSDLNDGKNTRTRYLIKISNVREDSKIEAYFRYAEDMKFYLRGLRGIANTAHARAETIYHKWAVTASDDSGWNIYYFFEENYSGKIPAHMYDFYETTNMADMSNSFFADTNLAHDIKHYHNVYMVKLKPGYNPNSLHYNNLLYNYSDYSSYLANSSKTKYLYLDSRTSSRTPIITNIRNQLGDTKESWKYMFHTFSDYYCHWDDGYSSIPSWNSWGTADSKSLVSVLQPFLTGIIDAKYYYGICVPEAKYVNQSLDINATAYKYKIQYNPNGGSIDLSNEQYSDGSQKYSNNGTTVSSNFEENHRHAVEKENDSSKTTAENEAEFSNVDGTVITLPQEQPSPPEYDGQIYFNGWKLVVWEEAPDDGQYYWWNIRDSSGNLIKRMPGQTYVIDDESVGYERTGAGYTSQLQSDVAINSSKPENGYAWGDFTSSDSNSLTFTWMADWKTIPASDLTNYKVESYRETPGAVLTKISNGAYVTTNDGKYVGEDGRTYDNLVVEVTDSLKGTTRTYTRYYQTTDSALRAQNNSTVISFNDHNPSDELNISTPQYELNENISSVKIVNLTKDTNDTIRYYFDIVRHDVELSETTAFSNGDSITEEMKNTLFNEIITLKDESENPVSMTLSSDVGDLVFENGKLIKVGSTTLMDKSGKDLSEEGAGDPVYPMKHGDTITITDFPDGFTLTVSEPDTLGYILSYTGMDNTTSSSGQKTVLEDSTVLGIVNTYTAEYAVTITELTQPREGDPDYTSKEKAFSILLTLTKDDDTVAEAGIYGEVEFATVDGATTATLSLANGQSKALSIPSGYKLTIVEDADSRTCSAGTYEVTFSENGGTNTTEAYSSQPVNAAKTITVINTLAAPDISSGILDGNNPFGFILAVLAGICAVAAGGTLYYTKRKKEDGTG